MSHLALCWQSVCDAQSSQNVLHVLLTGFKDNISHFVIVAQVDTEARFALHIHMHVGSCACKAQCWVCTQTWSPLGKMTTEQVYRECRGTGRCRKALVGWRGWWGSGGEGISKRPQAPRQRARFLAWAPVCPAWPGSSGGRSCLDTAALPRLSEAVSHWLWVASWA